MKKVIRTIKVKTNHGVSYYHINFCSKKLGLTEISNINTRKWVLCNIRYQHFTFQFVIRIIYYEYSWF